MFAPAGTPRPIRSKVSQDIAQALDLADPRDRMHKQGALPVTSTPEQFDAIIRSDTERNGEILRDAGISAR